ncbi:calpain-7 isoform X4 [Hydra vulgaris]|uniref:Calpain-7 isoform X4 n=1 Tax=Hydra vulgaris TaxID=6087 RepID=A0ABM4CXU6_HYDVU
MDVQQLFKDGMSFAAKAVGHDSAGEYDLAKFFYIEASEALLKVISVDQSISDAKIKVHQYMERAEYLTNLSANQKHSKLISQCPQQKSFEQIQFVLSQALTEDENGKQLTALPLYTDVVESCLKMCKETFDEHIKSKCNQWAKMAVERAELIKNSKSDVLTSKQDVLTSKQDVLTKTTFGNLMNSQKNSNKKKLSPSEIETLRLTSYVNGNVYHPLLDIDMNEQFAYKIPFTDPNGLLTLAPNQQSRFISWVRPSDICENPQMIFAVSSLSIKQTIVSDCSFVASLAISAAYERQFQRKLITSIIFPQRKDGTPIINPCGKYMVKLHFNGVARKVIIDDLLPMGKDGQLLCSFSQNCNEFWVSLLEKAYMKVMGGYDFPGSNSNIDLNALTGWIPERASLKSKDINSDVLFDRMLNGLEKGDVLITAATGVMSDAEADRAGLVPTHAYAVLNLKKVQGKKLCLLKNPWSHLRWKGNYSDSDTVNWTLSLESALGYNREKAAQNDNGVFWINWESVLRFYDVIYMNWNPKLFTYKYTLHAGWNAIEGPIKDAYNIGDNPQYRLEVDSDSDDVIIWILLTRHITNRDDFADNKEFITIHVYKSNGRRVYYPDGKYLEGTKINSPHYLAKLKVGSGRSQFTIVVSQYEKLNTIYYSLKVFSNMKFTIGPVPEIYSSKKKITMSWTKQSAGGSLNSPSYENNPKILLELISNTASNLLIKIETSRKYFAGVELRSADSSYRKNSGEYRCGFVAFTIESVPPGNYLIIPSTFNQGQEGPFFLEVQASCAMKLNTR